MFRLGRPVLVLKSKLVAAQYLQDYLTQTQSQAITTTSTIDAAIDAIIVCILLPFGPLLKCTAHSRTATGIHLVPELLCPRDGKISWTNILRLLVTLLMLTALLLQKLRRRDQFSIQIQSLHWSLQRWSQDPAHQIKSLHSGQPAVP